MEWLALGLLPLVLPILATLPEKFWLRRDARSAAMFSGDVVELAREGDLVRAASVAEEAGGTYGSLVARRLNGVWRTHVGSSRAFLHDIREGRHAERSFRVVSLLSLLAAFGVLCLEPAGSVYLAMVAGACYVAATRLAAARAEWSRSISRELERLDDALAPAVEPLPR